MSPDQYRRVHGNLVAPGPLEKAASERREESQRAKRRGKRALVARVKTEKRDGRLRGGVTNESRDQARDRPDGGDNKNR